MKRLLLILSLFLLANSFKFDDGSAFFALLATSSSKVQTISGSFEQIKHIKAIDQRVNASGNFYYSRSGNLRFDYNAPKSMSIIISGGQIKIKSNQNTTTLSLDRQRGLSDLAKILEACLSGNILAIPDTYMLDYSLTTNEHLLSIVPKVKVKSNPYSKIELKIGVGSLALKELSLFERSDDVTTYYFRDLTPNKKIAAALFNP